MNFQLRMIEIIRKFRNTTQGKVNFIWKRGMIMTEEYKEELYELLDILLKEKCNVEKGIGNTCYTDCPFYINGAYGGECAIGIVQNECE